MADLEGLIFIVIACLGVRVADYLYALVYLPLLSPDRASEARTFTWIAWWLLFGTMALRRCSHLLVV